MIIVPPDQIGNTTFCSGLYWQQSKWDGSKTIPVILEAFDSGALRMGVANGIVIAVPAQQVRAKFTMINQLVLAVGGEKYTLYGVGTTRSPQFSPDMVTYLQAHRATIARRHHEHGQNEQYRAMLDAMDVLTPFAAGNNRRLAQFANDGEAAKAAVLPWRTILPSMGCVME